MYRTKNLHLEKTNLSHKVLSTINHTAQTTELDSLEKSKVTIDMGDEIENGMGIELSMLCTMSGNAHSLGESQF